MAIPSFITGIMGISPEFRDYLIVVLVSLPFGTFFAAWLVGRYYKVSFLRRAIAVFSGWAFAFQSTGVFLPRQLPRACSTCLLSNRSCRFAPPLPEKSRSA